MKKFLNKRGFILSMLLFQSLIYSQETGALVEKNVNGTIMSIDLDVNEQKIALLNCKVNGSTSGVNLSHPQRTVMTRPLFSTNAAGQGVLVWQSLNPSCSKICMELAIYREDRGWSESFIISDDFEEIDAARYDVELFDDGQFSVSWFPIASDGTADKRKNMISNIGAF